MQESSLIAEGGAPESFPHGTLPMERVYCFAFGTGTEWIGKDAAQPAGMDRGKYMAGKNIKGIALALAAVLSLGLIGCGAGESELPDLSSLGGITVVAREEGSGTRTEFENLVDTSEEGANQTALSTEQVLELVSDDENAIGYVAFSAIGDASYVTVLSVDGVACTADTIGDGDYPLSREYILAYSGTLSDLENDFLTYVRSAGQDIVAGICTPVRSSTVF